VWHIKKEKVYLKTQTLTETGSREEKYSIDFSNFKINLYKTLSKFKKYDTISESKRIRIFSNFYLPIEITKTVNYEKEYVDVIYTEEEAARIAIEKLEAEFANTLTSEKNILNRQVNIYKQEGAVEIEVIYEVLEDIGVKDKIIF